MLGCNKQQPVALGMGRRNGSIKPITRQIVRSYDFYVETCRRQPVREVATVEAEVIGASVFANASNCVQTLAFVGDRPVSGNLDQRHSSGPERSVDVGDSQRIIGNVLQDVAAHDGIEPIAERQVGHIAFDSSGETAGVEVQAKIIAMLMKHSGDPMFRSDVKYLAPAIKDGSSVAQISCEQALPDTTSAAWANCVGRREVDRLASDQAAADKRQHGSSFEVAYGAAELVAAIGDALNAPSQRARASCDRAQHPQMLTANLYNIKSFRCAPGATPAGE